ncbi:MAG: diguanylate cyclase [Actinomycetota bacterium]|nr:diguanylate cyclase [Actinomycetota bacterium]
MASGEREVDESGGPRRAHALARVPRAVSSDPVVRGWAVVAVALTMWELLVAPHERSLITVTWLVQVGFDLVLVASSWRLARRRELGRLTRRFWASVAAGGALFAVGDTVRLVELAVGTGDAALAGGPVQGAFLSAGVFVIVCVLAAHPTELDHREKRRFLLDGTTVMVGATVFAWYFSPGRADGLVNGIVLPALALVAVFAAVKLIMTGHAPFSAAATTAACAATGAFVASIAMEEGTGSSTGLLASALLRITAAALVALVPRIQERCLQTDPAASTRRTRRPYSRLPYLAVGSTQILLVVALADRGLVTRTWGVLAGLLVITALVLARQLVAFNDNVHLLGRLDEAMLETTRQARRFRSMVQHSSDVTVITDARGVVTYVSPAIGAVLGLAPNRVVGHPALDLVHPTDRDEVVGGIRQLELGQHNGRGVVARARHADGSWRWLEVTSTNLLGEPSVDGIVSNARDVTETRQLHDRLRHQASHDGLTRLANRALFDERLERARTATPAVDCPPRVAVIMIDLDGFKSVNDTLGHHVGDVLLVHVAERLRCCVPPDATVARLGGDEFAVLLTGTEHEARGVAERIAEACDAPFEIDGHHVRIGASVGVAAGVAEDPRALVRHADREMYERKRDRKATGRPAT